MSVDINTNPMKEQSYNLLKFRIYFYKPKHELEQSIYWEKILLVIRSLYRIGIFTKIRWLEFYF
jgi:hypothetical protein